jgi:hypothetical protein
VLTIAELSEEQNKATSDLYFVECRTQLIETVGDTIRPVAAKRFGTRKVTLIYLLFTNCDISIVLLGDGVTLKGVQTEREVGVGDAVLVATSARRGRRESLPRPFR